VLQKDDHAMTAPSSIDPARFLDEQLAQASPDLLRSMLTTFINTLMRTAVTWRRFAMRSSSSRIRRPTRGHACRVDERHAHPPR
jgi:hypothetical protein